MGLRPRAAGKLGPLAALCATFLLIAAVVACYVYAQYAATRLAVPKLRGKVSMVNENVVARYGTYWQHRPVRFERQRALEIATYVFVHEAVLAFGVWLFYCAYGAWLGHRRFFTRLGAYAMISVPVLTSLPVFLLSFRQYTNLRALAHDNFFFALADRQVRIPWIWRYISRGEGAELMAVLIVTVAVWVAIRGVRVHARALRGARFALAEVRLAGKTMFENQTPLQP